MKNRLQNIGNAAYQAAAGLKRGAVPRRSYGAPAEPADKGSFEKFSASELFCPKCRTAMPVREKLLLVVPSGNIFDYICSRCGSSCGKRQG